MSSDNSKLMDMAQAQIIEEVRGFFKGEDFRALFKASLGEALRKEMDGIRKQLQLAEGRLLELESEVREKDKVIKQLQKQQDSNSEEILKLRRGMNEAEQYSRRTCVRLYGIPENANENTDQVMIDLAAGKLGIEIPRQEIDRSHRVGPPRRPHESTGVVPSRPILVKFATYRTREQVLRNRRRLKGTKIGIEEDLTSENRALLKEAKQKVDQIGKLNAAWSVDGKIFVSVNTENGKTAKKRIWSVKELNKL